jgi:hypothetical protein
MRDALSLRHRLEGSTTAKTETGSSSYGLVLCLGLLSTPPHDDAVTFGYRPMKPRPERTFTSKYCCAFRRTKRDTLLRASLVGPNRGPLSPATLSPIGVGRPDWIRAPLPPNRTCGSPAYGSPVGGSPSQDCKFGCVGIEPGDIPPLPEIGIGPFEIVQSTARSLLLVPESQDVS